MKLNYIEIMGILVGVFAIGFGIYWFFFMRKNKQENKSKEVQGTIEIPLTSTTYNEARIPNKLQESWSKNGEINAEIVDPRSHTIGKYHVELLAGKDYGRQFYATPNYLYELRITTDGVLEPLPHYLKMDVPPSEIYRAINTKEKVKEVFGNHEEGGDKLKLGLLVFAGCIALFLMFMAVYKGGK